MDLTNNAPVSGLGGEGGGQHTPTGFDIFVQLFAPHLRRGDICISGLMHETHTQTPILMNVCI